MKTDLNNGITETESLLPWQIYYYADSIFSSAGVKDDDIQFVTVGTGSVNVFMTIAAVRFTCEKLYLCYFWSNIVTPSLSLSGKSSVAWECRARWDMFHVYQVFIVEATGRRLLLLIGFGICCAACFVLTIALNFQVFKSHLKHSYSDAYSLTRTNTHPLLHWPFYNLTPNSCWTSLLKPVIKAWLPDTGSCKSDNHNLAPQQWICCGCIFASVHMAEANKAGRFISPFTTAAASLSLSLMLSFSLSVTLLLSVPCSLQQADFTWMPYLSIACVIIYVIGHAIGPSKTSSSSVSIHLLAFYLL